MDLTPASPEAQTLLRLADGVLFHDRTRPPTRQDLANLTVLAVGGYVTASGKGLPTPTEAGQAFIDAHRSEIAGLSG